MFWIFLASAPEEVKRVFSLENANQVQLTPNNSNLTLTRTSRYMQLKPKSISPGFPSYIYCNFTLGNSNPR